MNTSWRRERRCCTTRGELQFKGHSQWCMTQSCDCFHAHRSCSCPLTCIVLESSNETLALSRGSSSGRHQAAEACECTHSGACQQRGQYQRWVIPKACPRPRHHNSASITSHTGLRQNGASHAKPNRVCSKADDSKYAVERYSKQYEAGMGRTLWVFVLESIPPSIAGLFNHGYHAI